jgi:hypothetical protein
MINLETYFATRQWRAKGRRVHSPPGCRPTLRTIAALWPRLARGDTKDDA